MELKEIDEAAFESFVTKQTCDNFLQSKEMYHRYLKNGTECYLLAVMEKSQMRAAMLVSTTRKILGRKIFKIAGGPILDYDAKNALEILEFLTKALHEFLREKGGMAVRISPAIVAVTRDGAAEEIEGPDHKNIIAELKKHGWKYLGEYEQAKWTYVVPVAKKSDEELYQAIRKTHRQRIRKAEKAGIRLRELSLDELKIFEDLEGEAAKRHGFAGPSSQYYREMKIAFGDKVRLLVCEIPNEKGAYCPAAVGMFVVYGHEILCVYSGTAREFAKYGAAHFLRWEMIKEALRLGMLRYNFYGTHPIDGDGVYEFKRGFGGQVEELVGSFIMPLDVLGKVYVMRMKQQNFGDLR